MGRQRGDTAIRVLTKPHYFENWETFPSDVNLNVLHWQRVPVGQPAPLPTPPRVEHGLERGVTLNQPKRRYGDVPCPQSGVWQARLPAAPPQAACINGQTLRQAWVQSGDLFPDPQQDWLFSEDSGIQAANLVWRLVLPA